MPFEHFGQWVPLDFPRIKPFLYNDPAIICQAINIRNQIPCSNKLYGTYYDQCRECGAIVCLWHSGYRYMGYKVCDACYSSLSKLALCATLSILCKFCERQFTSYLELQRHYQPQEIREEELYKVYKINHGKLLNQYNYNGPWLYKVPKYNRSNKCHLLAINMKKSIHIERMKNPDVPIGRYQNGWIMPLNYKISSIAALEEGQPNIFKETRQFTVGADQNNNAPKVVTLDFLKEIKKKGELIVDEDGDEIGSTADVIKYKERVYKIIPVTKNENVGTGGYLQVKSNNDQYDPNRQATVWNNYYKSLGSAGQQFSNAKGYFFEEETVLDTPYIKGNNLSGYNRADKPLIKKALQDLEKAGYKGGDYNGLGNVRYSDVLKRPVIIDLDSVWPL